MLSSMNKLFLLLLLYSGFLAAILMKLFVIQVLSEDHASTKRYLKTIPIAPMRGQIFDRSHQPLVLNQTLYRVFAEPQKINEKETVIDKLENIVHVDSAALSSKLAGDKQWVPLAAAIDKKTKDAIEKLKLEGIGFEEDRRRFYPESSAAAHLLGFVGKNEEGGSVGYFGIEGYYEQDLAGLSGILKTERDILGEPIFAGVQDEIQGEDGRDLILTINTSVQTMSKAKLINGMEKYGAKEGCIIVADPYSLEIIALTCLPDFDPDLYGGFTEAYFRNPAVSTQYEPGSIFKPFVMAAALNEKAVAPDDIYEEKGPLTIGSHVIKTWNDTYEGTISMTRILEKSSNVGLVAVGEKLGRHQLLSYLKKYGIGSITGIDLQGEIASSMKPSFQWRPIDFATVTFGQGIAVTQIQILSAFAALINGGNLLIPHVVGAFRSHDGRTQKVEVKKIRRVINEVASRQIKKMLESTVENGDARWARPAGYRIGGKTGTAQIPVAGQYDPNKTIASFVGFAPLDKPKFIVLITLKEPSSSPWGSETAAPLFFDLAKELFVYYNIAPEQIN